MSPSKRLPLVVLHRSRVTGGPTQYDKNKKLLESWNKSGALYATPRGSNDDCSSWYEGREENIVCPHALVRLASSDRPELRMPPPYSIVIQESEQGSWHVPTVVGDDLETLRQWICATRARGASSRRR